MTRCCLIFAFLIGSLAVQGCGRGEEGGETGAATRSQSFAQAQFPQVIRLAIDEKICSRRDQTIKILVENQAERILERCRNDVTDPCALNNECLKREVRVLEPGLAQWTFGVTDSLAQGRLISDTERQILIKQEISRSEGSRGSSLTIFFGFKLTQSRPNQGNRSTLCVSPLQTTSGRTYVNGLLRAIESVTRLGKDPCVPTDGAKLISSGTENTQNSLSSEQNEDSQKL